MPVALSTNGVGLLHFGFPEEGVFFVSAVWVLMGPTLAAFIMTGATEGRAGISRLLRRYVLWRVGLRWYLVVLFGPPVVILLVTMMGQLFPAPVVTGYGSALPLLIGLGGTTLLIVALTRGRLGYQNYRQEVDPDSAAVSA